MSRKCHFRTSRVGSAGAGHSRKDIPAGHGRCRIAAQRAAPWPPWDRAASEGYRMRRREFIALLGPLIIWAGSARSQKRVPPEIGLLSSRSASESASLIAAFHEGLKEGGYVEGQNLVIQ